MHLLYHQQQSQSKPKQQKENISPTLYRLEETPVA
jgi:hypothetical protein